MDKEVQFSSLNTSDALVIDELVRMNTDAEKELKGILPQNGFYPYNFMFTCELKVCSTKKPWNPTAPPALPAVPELSALCVIRAPALKGGKNVSENNA